MKNQPQKLKIKEAGGVVDNPVSKDKILERLSAMSQDIIFVRKELENGNKDEDLGEDFEAGLEEDMKNKEEDDVKEIEEEMIINGYTMRNEWEEIQKNFK